MTANQVVSSDIFRQLGQMSTCLASNAIERLNGRVRNEGSISGSAVHCIFPHLPPMLGYAVTARMRSTTQPAYGRAYHENMHWWRYVASMPEPRVLVVEDADEYPGAGALLGELHALIGSALGCRGYVSNGSVRDVAELEALGFPVFAGSVAVSHMYAHIAEYGKPVEIGGLKILPGELLHGDRNGVHIIPLSVVAEIPRMAAQILAEEQQIRDLCQSPGFSLHRLEKKLGHVPGGGVEVPLDGK